MLKKKSFLARLTLTCFMVGLLSIGGFCNVQYDVSAAGAYTFNDTFETTAEISNWIISPGTGNTCSVQNRALLLTTTAASNLTITRPFPAVTGRNAVYECQFNLGALPTYAYNFLSLTDDIAYNNIGQFGLQNSTFKLSWGNNNASNSGNEQTNTAIAGHKYTIRYDINFGSDPNVQGTFTCTLKDLTLGTTLKKWTNKPISGVVNNGKQIYPVSITKTTTWFQSDAPHPSSVSIDNVRAYDGTVFTPTMNATTSLDSSSGNIPVKPVFSVDFNDDLDLNTINNIKVQDSGNNDVAASVFTVSGATYRSLNIAVQIPLNFDSNYNLVIPTTATNIYGDGLASAKIIPFTTKAKPPSQIQVTNERIVDDSGNPVQTLIPSANATLQATVVDINTDPDAQKDIVLILTLTDQNGIIKDISYVKKSIIGGQAPQLISTPLTLPAALPSDVSGWHLNAFVWGDEIPGDVIVSKYSIPEM